MQTSNFFNFTGNGRIAISRSVPRGLTSGYRIYRKLAPGAWFKDYNGNQALYRERYFNDILSKLNPAQEYDILHDLVKGHEPILLCWEDINKKGQWCHRRMVAEWFKAELGVSIPEYKPEAKPLPLFNNI